MSNTGVIIFLLSLIGFFGPLLIFGILKITKRNLDNHKKYRRFLIIYRCPLWTNSFNNVSNFIWYQHECHRIDKD